MKRQIAAVLAAALLGALARVALTGSLQWLPSGASAQSSFVHALEKVRDIIQPPEPAQVPAPVPEPVRPVDVTLAIAQLREASDRIPVDYSRLMTQLEEITTQPAAPHSAVEQEREAEKRSIAMAAVRLNRHAHLLAEKITELQGFQRQVERVQLAGSVAEQNEVRKLAQASVDEAQKLVAGHSSGTLVPSDAEIEKAIGSMQRELAEKKQRAEAEQARKAKELQEREAKEREAAKLAQEAADKLKKEQAAERDRLALEQRQEQERKETAEAAARKTAVKEENAKLARELAEQRETTKRAKQETENLKKQQEQERKKLAEDRQREQLAEKQRAEEAEKAAKVENDKLAKEATEARANADRAQQELKAARVQDEERARTTQPNAESQYSNSQPSGYWCPRCGRFHRFSAGPVYPPGPERVIVIRPLPMAPQALPMGPRMPLFIPGPPPGFF